MILCKNGHPNPDGSTYCRVCNVYIDSTVPATEPTPEPETKPTPTPVPHPVRPLVTLSQSSLSSQPGGSVTCDIAVENPGETQGDYTVAVDGRAAPWASVDPAALSLGPGARASAKLTFHIGADAAAGPVPFEVKVAAKDVADPPTPVPGIIEITLPAPTLSAQVRPERSGGNVSADLVLSLQNPTGKPVTAAVSGLDPAGMLAFEFQPQVVTVPPGGGSSASLHLQAHKRLFLRGRRELRFEVLVVPEGGSTTKVEATFVQDRSTLRLFGRLVWAFLGLIGFLIVAVILLLLLKL
jgi:hypothetical protein